MRSIRQIALGKDEPETKSKGFNFDDDYYDSDYGYGAQHKQNSLFDKNTDGQMTLKISIPFEKIGIKKDFAENCAESDFNKAEEYALKEIKKFAGADWESRYSYSVEDCLELLNSVDLEIILSPLN